MLHNIAMLSHSYTDGTVIANNFQVQILFQKKQPMEVWIKLSTPPISRQPALAPGPQPNDRHPQKLLGKKSWQVIG